MNKNKDLEYKIRDILDRNNFISQKVDLDSIKTPPGAPPIQDAFRIRVMQPLRFAVEIVKPKQMKDLFFVAGRLNISKDHVKLIEKMDPEKRLDLFDEIRINLAPLGPTFKFNARPNSSVVDSIECMIPIYYSLDEQYELRLITDLFMSMESINKNFFLVIILLQRFLRKLGFNPNDMNSQSEGSNPFYQ